MNKKLALGLTMGMACLYATGASAAELTEASAAGSDVPAIETTDQSAYSVAGVAASSLAAAETTGSGGSGWEFAVTPYLWAAGTKVKIETPQGEDINVDESFTEVLGDLKFAFMGAFEAKHGRLISVQDIIYLSLGSSADAHIGPIPLEADVDEKLFTSTHLFGYRVVDKGPMFVDLFAGARITSVKVDVDLSTPLQTFHRSNKKTEVGPVIASRIRAPLGGRWGAAIYGDIGGFGVAADISWELLGTIQYDLSDRWRFSAGWRHFYARQDKGDFDIHLKLDGPILGATFSF